MQHKYQMIYRYPSSYANLIEKSSASEAELKKLGWLEPIFNQNFIIWYKLNGNVQLIPINVQSHEMERLKSLSNEIPFAYKFAKSKETLGAKLCIVESPVNAIILQDQGILSIATGGAFVHESHVRHLALLHDFELIFVSEKANISAADAFSKRLGAIGRECFIALIDSWDGLFESGDHESFIEQVKKPSVEFLVDRIISKRRKSEGLSVQEELITASQGLSTTIREQFNNYAQEQGFSINKQSNFSCAFRLMSELLLADINYKDAASIVSKRYDINIDAK